MPRLGRLRAGDLRWFGTVYAPTVTADAARGQVEGSPAVVATAWFAIQPLDGRELVQGEQVTASQSHRLRTWYQVAFKASQRIVIGTRTFEIVTATNISEDNESHLLCEELVNS